MWLVYILRCSDGTLYTGSTNDLERRVEAHNAGKGAKYTRGRGPVEVMYQSGPWAEKSMALRIEAGMKKLTRKQKLDLIQQNEDWEVWISKES